MSKAILILNGFEADDAQEQRVRVLLRRVLEEGRSAYTEVVARDLRLGHCIGCFGCFVRTPGICIVQDQARPVMEQLVSSDVVVLLGRISFGGYSSALKRIVDRVLPLLTPFFMKVHGETHHPARYEKLPRIVALGVQNVNDSREAAVFRTLVGRNAINLHAPSHASEVLSQEQTDDELELRIRSALERSDPVPWRTEMDALVPAAHTCPTWLESRPRRMLSIVGSPKTGPSTSAALAGYLERRMQGHGWETEHITLKAGLAGRSGREALVSAAQRADLISLATPLYVDSLQYLSVLALETLVHSEAVAPSPEPKRFISLVNSGFPEAFQNTVALAICERFAIRAGWLWAGGLALGAGEALVRGEPLDVPVRGRPSPRHLLQALDLSADRLAIGHTIPPAAQALFDRCPIPGLPASWWGAIYRSMGAHIWRTMARKLSVDPRTLRARPVGKRS